MELFNLRLAAEMYGYSIEWNAKERSVTLVYMGSMDEMMMESSKPAGEMIKLWIGSKKIVVDDEQVSLEAALSRLPRMGWRQWSVGAWKRLSTPFGSKG